ncbi:SOS response-associated peptidase family protein [Aquincola sp. S2]|uniref:Abasic site processing protein n=1 Tax=Pseudaquabacterium terrae TaxID=2732868 RepID=A0ABX2ES19_9BURK|nr:SOS response-associated peptidase family protein [Aquabacterium terrae]NRF71413.1 SOS response-associated peptidase family protein [Aquabacterium terrae]
MCNLYNMSPKGEVERYIGAMWREQMRLDNPVPPFGTGLFARAAAGGGLELVAGQWGMIRPGSPARREMVGKRPRMVNNSRAETVAKLATFRQAWAKGQRCLIPAEWYQEPNWETARNVWWRLRRTDGEQWAIAGLWSEWTDRETGEVVPNYTAITVNCDDHPMLKRLHRPDPELPPDRQDKRSLVHIDPVDWDAWLNGSEDQALQLLRPPALELFDQTDARRTDELLQQLAAEREPTLF